MLFSLTEKQRKTSWRCHSGRGRVACLYVEGELSWVVASCLEWGRVVLNLGWVAFGCTDGDLFRGRVVLIPLAYVYFDLVHVWVSRKWLVECYIVFFWYFSLFLKSQNELLNHRIMFQIHYHFWQKRSKNSVLPTISKWQPSKWNA